MANYKYKAINKAGASVNSSIEAPDRRAAVNMLKAKGLQVLQIGEFSGSGASASAVKKIAGGKKLSLVFFTKLEQLCQGAMPVGDALRSLSQRSLNENLKNLSRALYKDLSEGKALSIAIAQYPSIFDKTIVHLLEAGESSANLVPIFRNIIDYLEEKKQLRAKMVSATAYPAFLSLLAFGVVLFFLFYMLPKIESMMQSMGGELTLPVKILTSMGNFAIAQGPFVIIAFILAIFGLNHYRKTEKGLLKTDEFALRIPLLGSIILNADLCRITGLCSILFGSGVNTTETLRLAEKSIANTYLRANFQKCKSAINDGAPISVCLKKYNILPDDDIDIISVGERTGSLVASFADLRKLHYVVLNQRIKIATGILATFALGGAFFLVFLIALGIVSSVLNLTQTIMSR